jgi:hypothetical protein
LNERVLTADYADFRGSASRLAAKPLPKSMLGKAERMIMLEDKRGSA